jgi:hypothetical protein
LSAFRDFVKNTFSFSASYHHTIDAKYCSTMIDKSDLSVIIDS